MARKFEGKTGVETWHGTEIWGYFYVTCILGVPLQERTGQLLLCMLVPLFLIHFGAVAQ